MSRRKYFKAWKYKAPRVVCPGESTRAVIGVREPPAYKVRTLAEKLRDLQGEALELANGARMGSTLLAEHNAFPEAARFLDGLCLGMTKVAERLKSELDDDAIPF